MFLRRDFLAGMKTIPAERLSPGQQGALVIREWEVRRMKQLQLLKTTEKRAWVVESHNDRLCFLCWLN